MDRSPDSFNAGVYLVAYTEVVSASQDEVIARLRQYREASRRPAGNHYTEILQQHDRAGHFVRLELWQNQEALEVHRSASQSRALDDALQPWRLSPDDERLHTGLALGPLPATAPPGAVYVVTHADAVPAGKDAALVLLQTLAEASRQEAGNRRFDVLQQHSRQNHCTIVELWQHQQALEAHVQARHTRHFRAEFQPLSGSLYDERLYRVLD
jgi:quinol monooxygenase YgiN